MDNTPSVDELKRELNMLDEKLDDMDETEIFSLSDLKTVDTKKPLVINSGYEAIDELVDFRAGNTYLIAGYEKSGKSSFAFGTVLHLLNQNRKVAFFNTELTDGEFITALTALAHDISKDEADTKQELKDILIELYKDKLIYSGINQLSENGKLSFEKTLAIAKKAKSKKTKIYFFDNLTSYASQSTAGKKGWEVLADTVSKVITFTKENNLISFIVLHTRPETIFNESPAGIRKLVETKEIEQVFEKSITVVRRPSGNDIYGGGGIRSQVSGQILIWRPFQLFDKSPHLQGLTQIILENFRHCKGGSARFVFDGSKGQFKEDPLAGVMENLKS